MKRITPRRSLTACALSAAALVALAVPGAASAAKKVPPVCTGENIVAAGSTLQKLAVKSIWGPDFNTSKNEAACGGTSKPTITYESIGSGQGLEDFGFNGHAFEAGRVAIATTDEPVDTAEKAEIEANESVKGSTPESIQSIPVLQAAVALDVHLPENCTATSTTAPGRLVLDNVTLEKIWKGQINNWSEIKDNGDSVSGTGCVATTPITRLVRLDKSGTTYIFKKYLNLINGSAIKTSLGELTWNQMAAGTNNNAAWPEAASVVHASAEGGGKLVAQIAATPSSIGYASLADSRANGEFSKVGKGGPTTSKFWVELQNNGTATKSEKYADPATNGDAEPLGNSNCEKTKYTNGAGTKFPPANTGLTWDEVTTSTKEKNYSMCGLTYDEVFKKYSAYPGTTSGEAATAGQFVKFELNTAAEGGQQLLLNNDYEPLPKNLVKEAQAGAALIAF